VAGAKTEEWASFVRDLGIELNRRRTSAGLSQERVAHAAGLTRGYYQQLERGSSRSGRIANPTIQTLIALAQVLNSRVEDLLPPDPPDMTAGR